MSVAERIGLEHPVVQAGMGGGIAGPQLAGAVSAVGALGTVGIMPPAPFARALASTREQAAGRPFAANLLVPFTRPAHVRACVDARVPVVVLHAGRAPEIVRALGAEGIEVLQTVGSAAEAREAVGDGVSGLIAQGGDAGGHLVGVRDTETTLAEVLDAAPGTPVWAAGGVADARDVTRLLGLGAEAAVAGTRFVMTDECGVHPAYKQALVDGEDTVDTTLFGFGWPMRHRVLVNAAVERWGEGPAPVRALNARTAKLGGMLPLRLMATYPRLQSIRSPVFTAGPALAGMPERFVGITPLYAGESVARLRDVIPAADAVALLTGRSSRSDESRRVGRSLT